MLNPKFSSLGASVSADAICALLNNGYLRVFDGTQPLDADAPLDGQVLLAELRFGAAAFGPAQDGVATARMITADADASATGEATWFRALRSDGSTVVWDGSIDPTSGDIVLDSALIQVHALVSVMALTFTQLKG